MIVVSGSTKAVVGAFAKIRGVNTTAEEDDRAGEVFILAYEEVDALAVVATVGGAGTAAIELSVLVASVNSTVSAVVENHVKILSKENVSVKSDARRNFEGFIFSIAGSGTASISANIAVVSVGSKLNKDAYDAIYQKDGDSSGVDPVATTGYVESFAEFKPASANAKKSKTGKLSAVMSSDDESVMKITGADDPKGTGIGDTIIGCSTGQYQRACILCKEPAQMTAAPQQDIKGTTLRPDTHDLMRRRNKGFPMIRLPVQPIVYLMNSRTQAEGAPVIFRFGWKGTTHAPVPQGARSMQADGRMRISIIQNNIA